MDIVLHLSMEHPELPKAEVSAVLEGEGIGYKFSEDYMQIGLLIATIDSDNADFINRLALTKSAGELVHIGDNLPEIASMVSEKISEESFAVRSESKTIEEELGRLIWEKGHKVDLITPDTKILCFKEDGRYVIAIDTPLTKEFEKRKPKRKPFFHPTGMNPKLARLMVNLGRVKAGDVIFDPFCGTGSILIEAGLMDMKVKGLDINSKIVEGCKENLKFYGLRGSIRVGDILDITSHGRVDAIVTDPPYGRSSFVTDRNLKNLYRGFISSAAEILSEGKYLVMSLPNEFRAESDEFDIIEKYSWYVHRSLTRQIYVLRRA